MVASHKGDGEYFACGFCGKLSGFGVYMVKSGYGLYSEI